MAATAVAAISAGGVCFSWSETGMAPGWYPDQNDATLMRYFDGQTWTSQTRRN